MFGSQTAMFPLVWDYINLNNISSLWRTFSVMEILTLKIKVHVGIDGSMTLQFFLQSLTIFFQYF